jgi:hypothetical protein
MKDPRHLAMGMIITLKARSPRCRVNIEPTGSSILRNSDPDLMQSSLGRQMRRVANNYPGPAIWSSYQITKAVQLRRQIFARIAPHNGSFK